MQNGKSVFLVGVLAFAVSGGCSCNGLFDQPIPHAKLRAGATICYFSSRATAIVRAQIASVGAPQKKSLEDRYDADYTPITLSIQRTLKGPYAGSLAVWLRGHVNSRGDSLAGYLKSPGGAWKDGYFFLDDVDGVSRIYFSGGFFWEVGDSVANIGDYHAGIPKADFLGEVEKYAGLADWKDCPDVPDWMKNGPVYLDEKGDAGAPNIIVDGGY